MAEPGRTRGGSSNDTSEYAPSKAPETRREATEQDTKRDHRLIPGGGAGAPVEIGMSALDPETVPSLAGTENGSE